MLFNFSSQHCNLTEQSDWISVTVQVSRCFLFQKQILPFLCCQEIFGWGYVPSFNLTLVICCTCRPLGTVHRSTQRSVTGCKAPLISAPCTPAAFIGPAQTHWYICIYKSILGLLPSCVCGFILYRVMVCAQMTPPYCPSLRFTLRQAFMLCGPAAWSHWQTDLQLQSRI